MFAPVFLFIVIYKINLLSSTKYYVDGGLLLSGSGQDWSQAFNSLNTALAAAYPGDEIWLKGGHTYIPTSSVDRTDCFKTCEDISIYGGFDGNELNINKRAPINNRPQSIISGDIGHKDDASDNCYHVIQYKKSLTLDGVIIEGGNANYNGNNLNDTLHKYGGALITQNVAFTTNLKLKDVTIRNNKAMGGGGLFVSSNDINNVQVVIKDSFFINNQAIDGRFEGGYGGAIYQMFLANVSLFNTEFVSNNASYRGGAIYQDYGAILYADNCNFVDNLSNGFGGAIFSEDRNSQTVGTFPKIYSSVFRDNYAGIDGGAIYFYNGVIGTLEKNIYRSNVASNFGGAIALINSIQTLIINSSFIELSNEARGDNTTNDIYNKTDYQYTSMTETQIFDPLIDDTLFNFNLTQELKHLYTKWNSENVNQETDIYPFTKTDINISISICYVDIDNGLPVNNQNGNSWSTAYNDLQSCLESLKLETNGGEVWVKYGEYIPSSVPEWKQRVGKTSGIHQSFSMYDNIRMYGGFDGSETSRDERNWRDNPTYLSCQINNRVQCQQIIQAADNTIIDGFIFINAGTGVSTRRRMANSLNLNLVLSSTSGSLGSGVYSNSTNIFVVNSIFHKLLAVGKGGAVYCIGQQGGNETTAINKSPTFINVAFLGNRAGARGGAISGDASCHFKCKYCNFNGNQCSKKGGGIYIDFDSDIEIIDSIFQNNLALESGGCIAADGKSVVTFTNDNQFISNKALMEGGCLYSGSGVGPRIDQGFEFKGNPISTLFLNNTMLNRNGLGQADAYGWPYSKIAVPLSSTAETTTSRPTTSPTPSPVSPINHDDIQPNIVIFVIDDILFTKDWSISAPHGTELQGTISKSITYNDFVTPNIAVFMEEAVIFPQSYVAGPKCAPSRFAILTGRQTSRAEWAVQRTLQTCSGKMGTNVTIQTSKITLNDSVNNIPFILKNDANTPYWTGMVGKWHVMGSNEDIYGCGLLAGTENETLYNLCTGIVRNQGFDFVDAWYYSNIGENNHFGHNPEWMVSQSQKFIQQAQARNKPFFLYFASTLAHSPSSEISLNHFTRKNSPKGELKGVDNPDDTLMQPRGAIWEKATDLAGSDSNKKEFYAQAIWTDDQFGALINYLKAENIYDKTLIVLMNDHGMGAKGVLYQQGSRIINYVRYPPLFGDNGPYIMPKDFVVSSVDLGAVIFEITGINPPDDYVSDGISWVHDVQQEINAAKQQIDHDQQCCKYRYIDIKNSHSIVNGDYQYIYRANPTQVEQDNDVDQLYLFMYDEQQLYDLKNDPNQRNNQINNFTLKSVINEFQSLMQDYLYDICPLSDKSQCKKPNLSWTESPTAQPTVSPYCQVEDGTIREYKHVFQPIERSELNNDLNIYRDSGLAEFSDTDCYNIDQYYYNDIYRGGQKKLTIDYKICCNNKIFDDEYRNKMLNEGDFELITISDTKNNDNNNNNWFNLDEHHATKVVVVFAIVSIALCCCIMAGYIYFFRRAQFRKFKKKITGKMKQKAASGKSAVLKTSVRYLPNIGHHDKKQKKPNVNRRMTVESVSHTVGSTSIANHLSISNDLPVIKPSNINSSITPLPQFVPISTMNSSVSDGQIQLETVKETSSYQE